MLFNCNYSNGNGYTKATAAIELGKRTKIVFIYCGRLDVKELGLELIVMRFSWQHWTKYNRTGS